MRKSPGFTCRSGFRPRTLALLIAGLVVQMTLFSATSFAAVDGDCVALNVITIDSDSLLDPSTVQALSQTFEGNCIDARLIGDVLTAISDDFIKRGYVTTRPYLLEQDISDGEIEIEVLVGFVEAVIDAASGESNASITGAFAFNNKILNLRELETSLEVIERPRSIQASFEIIPGSQQGGSVVAIKTTETSPFHLELGANARTNIDPQLSVRATLDNPFNINDVVEYRYNSGDIYQVFESDRSRELDYSVGFGSYLLSYLHSDISYRRRVQGFSGSLLAEGDSVSDQLRLGKLLGRSQAYRLNMSIGLELEDSRNLFEGEVIDVSSYRTSKAEIALRHDWFTAWGQLFSRYSYQQGLASFGARDDEFFNVENGNDSDASLQFEKHLVEAQLYYYLPQPGWQIDVKLHGQYSEDLLYDADKLFLGSESTVRGYTSALAGSNGWYARSDLVKRLQSLTMPFSEKPLSKIISLSLGIDYGEIRCEVDNPDLCGQIYGLGAAAQIVDDNFSALLSWGHPLEELQDDIGNEDIFLLDLRWGL